MFTKIKIGAAGIVVTALVLATWVYLFDPTAARNRDEVQLTLVVIFAPAHRGVPLDVVAGINGNPTLAEKASASPWITPFMAPRGALVSLMAVQPEHGPMLTCTIKGKTGSLGPSAATPTPQGSSSCFITAIAS